MFKEVNLIGVERRMVRIADSRGSIGHSKHFGFTLE